MNAKHKETHPLEPFLPDNALVLMLGSFPPTRERWSMDFFYPNFNNDMWRIIGGIFFNDMDRFTDKASRRFRKDRIEEFCNTAGIALYDTAKAVIRLKGNASDKYLEIVERTDIPALLEMIPSCRAVVTTGQKASETAACTLGCSVPETGGHTVFRTGNVAGKLYRMPSSSRAYPMKIEEKMRHYARMFIETGLLKGFHADEGH